MMSEPRLVGVIREILEEKDWDDETKIKALLGAFGAIDESLTKEQSRLVIDYLDDYGSDDY